jgi:nucleotide-binding universal stress UspA family protein
VLTSFSIVSKKIVLLLPKKVDTLRSEREIKHIVVALDVSGTTNKVLDKAISLAKLSDAKITGIYVIGIQPTLLSGVINDRETKKAEKILRSLKKYCEKKGIEFAFKVLIGKPASKISEFAKRGKVDLVVIGSKGIGGFKGKVLGSVANSILIESKASVLLVK